MAPELAPSAGSRPRRGRRRVTPARIRNGLLSLTALALVVLAWAVWSSQSRLLPTIGDVVAAAPAFYQEPEMLDGVLATLRRVVISVGIALVLGILGAVASRRGGLVGRVVDVYVALAIAIPSTVAALLALFIFRRSEIGVFVVVTLVIWPFMVMTLRGGLEVMDRKLGEMAAVYRMTPLRRLTQVVVPHLVPYAFAAVRSENAHAWRVVVLAEVFAINSGMGAQFTRAYDRFLLEDVLLWIVTFIGVLLVIEYLVLRPLEAYFMRWRFSDVS
jgi:NitT/TauT family transport system permease protein